MWYAIVTPFYIFERNRNLFAIISQKTLSCDLLICPKFEIKILDCFNNYIFNHFLFLFLSTFSMHTKILELLILNKLIIKLLRKYRIAAVT